MRKIFILSAIILGIATAPATAQDKKAKEILESANKKISGLKTLKADFTLELKGGGVNDKKKGTFYMKGSKYRVEIAGQEIICDAKTVWTYIKATNEVQITEYNPDAQTISPAKLFTTGFYDKEYNYDYVGQRKINGKVCDVVELTPKSSDKMFSKVQMAVDKNNTIAGGQVWEKNGNTFRYDINNFTANAGNITDATFTFDPKKHPGVEVIDLR